MISFVILHAAQQLTGINAIFYYSNSFFVGIIDNPLVGTSLVGVVNVVATYVALQLMDKTGRVRPCSIYGPNPVHPQCPIISKRLRSTLWMRTCRLGLAVIVGSHVSPQQYII